MDNINEYGPKGKLAYWQETEALRNPLLAAQYVELLFDEKILPPPSDARGFVLLSPSANQGLFEFEMAEKLDSTMTEKPEKKPMFIAADMFGEIRDNQFVPGFWKDFYTDEFKNVDFHKLSADAKNTPLKANSVDVIWDRLGALWHTQNSRVTNGKQDLEDIYRVLNEYRRLLKPGGVVVIDAAVKPEGATNSTDDFLSGNFSIKGRQIDSLAYKVDLDKLGWEIRYIGNDAARLAVLKPTNKLETP